MTDTPQPCQKPPSLTGMQVTRLDYARRDLDSVSSEDLAALPPDRLILLIMRLRTRLDDVVNLVDELHKRP